MTVSEHAAQAAALDAHRLDLLEQEEEAKLALKELRATRKDVEREIAKHLAVVRGEDNS